MTSESLSLYQVSAYNTAHDSENKIHDDATAKRFGFKGGLVGGVYVYAYMSHMPVQRWGRAWLERGTGEARFGKPVVLWPAVVGKPAPTVWILPLPLVT